MGWSLVTLGRMREAARRSTRLLSNTKPIRAVSFTPRVRCCAQRMAIAAARKRTSRQRSTLGKGFGHFHHTALTIGEVYSVLGDLDRAQEWVEKASNDGFP